MSRAYPRERWGSLRWKDEETKPSTSCKTSSTCRAGTFTWIYVQLHCTAPCVNHLQLFSIVSGSLKDFVKISYPQLRWTRSCVWRPHSCTCRYHMISKRLRMYLYFSFWWNCQYDLFFAQINFPQIMWVLVLTARRQLQWEFSNVCVARKTTSTIGSQRWI